MAASTITIPCLIPGGLANMGNTCYVNTTLQCLVHCPTFLSFVLDHTPIGNASTPKDTPVEIKSNGSGSLMGELQSLLKELCVDGYSMMPKRFLHALQIAMGNMLHIAEQNDLPEFLMLLIDRLCVDIGVPLDPGLLQRAEQEIQRSIRQNNAIAHLTWSMEQNWLKHNARDSSPLKDMFYGQQVMQTRCDACQYLGHNHETFFMLSLGLPPAQPNPPDSPATASQASPVPVRIADLIADHVKSEAVMDGIWRCDGCKSRGQSCTTTVRLWKLPEILVIVLKRFAQVPTLRKLHTPVQLDQARVLDMSEHSICDADSTYDLASIACHMGSVHGGHYYAICRQINAHTTNKWFRIDDLQVQEIKDPMTHLAAAERDAYVLFYQLRHSRHRANLPASEA